MQYLLIILPFVAISMAQRPTYAGLSAKGYPELASRFRDPADDQDSGNKTDTTDTSAAVGNRLGEVDDQNQVAQNIPTDARGDVSLVNRLNQWPRENRPFWLLNAQHLEKHRHPDVNQQNQQGVVQNQQGGQAAAAQTNISQEGRVQSRFGEPVGTETLTIRSINQRGSFAGSRP